MIPETVEEFAKLLKKQRRRRRSAKKRLKPGLLRRRTLSSKERAQILAKTANRCHICGGLIEGRSWHADHVLAHSVGGGHAAENYLPAHILCNHYRWDYSSEEFQEILKLGVWVRTQIIRGSDIGKRVGKGYLAYERAREKRRQMI